MTQKEQGPVHAPRLTLVTKSDCLMLLAFAFVNCIVPETEA